MVREEPAPALEESLRPIPPNVAPSAARSEGPLSLRLRRVDANDDGFLSKDEWAAFLAKTYPEGGSALLSFEDFLSNRALTSDIPEWATKGDCVLTLDKAGWCTVTGLMAGFERSSCDKASCLENVAYVPYKEEELECKDVDWTYSFDKAGWSTCSEGYYMSGLRRTGTDNRLSDLDEVKCCRPKGGAEDLWDVDDCKDQDWVLEFDEEGWASCPEGTALHGLKRSGSRSDEDNDKLFNIEYAKCCTNPFKKQEERKTIAAHLEAAVEVEQLTAAAQKSSASAQAVQDEETKLQETLGSMSTKVKGDSDFSEEEWAAITKAVEVKQAQKKVDDAPADETLKAELTALQAQLPAGTTAESILLQAAAKTQKRRMALPDLGDPAEKVQASVDVVKEKATGIKEALEVAPLG